MRHLNQLRTSIFGLAVLLVGLFGINQNAFATSLVTDDFDSYTAGNELPPPIWANTGGLGEMATSTVSQSSPNSLTITSGRGSYATTTDIITGNQVFYVYAVSGTATPEQISFYDGNDLKESLYLLVSGGLLKLQTYHDYNVTGSDIGTYSLNAWHKIELQWAPTNQLTWLVDDVQKRTGSGDFAFSHLNKLQTSTSASSDLFYYDDFGGSSFIPPDSITLSTPIGTQTTPVYSFTGSWNLNATTTGGYYIDIVTSTSSTVTTNATATSTNVWHTNTSIGSDPALTGNFNYSNGNVFDLNTNYYSKAIFYYFTFENFPNVTYHFIAESSVNTWQINTEIQNGNATTAQEFYASNNPDWFATTTPTVVYSSMTAAGNLILSPFMTIAINWSNLYNPPTFLENGKTVGNSTALIFAYATQVNQIFNFPIVEITLILIVLELALIIWKQTTRGIKTAK